MPFMFIFNFNKFMLYFYFNALVFLRTSICFMRANQTLPEEEYNITFKFQKQNCMLWNANVTLAPNLNLMNLQIRIALFPDYKNCFTFYEIYLHKMWPQYFNQCDLHKSTRIGLLIINFHPNQVVSVAFNNLKNGNYCIVILPCRHKKKRGRNPNICLDAWALHSDVVYVEKEVKNVKKLKETSSKISALELISGITILVLILSCVLTIYFKAKSRAFELNKKSLDVRIEEEEVIQFLVPQNIIVYILHSQEEGTKRKIRLLKDFLTNCASCTVILIEDILEEIYPDPIVWLNHMLEYKCSKKYDMCDSNKRFIIAQTERVLHYIKYKTNSITSKRNSAISFSSGDDEIERDWFHYALNSISINWSKCLSDYCHLFVVCFNDALCYDNSIKNISPCVRYTIPDQLINLCIDLNPTLSEEQLKKRFSAHPIRSLIEESPQI